PYRSKRGRFAEPIRLPSWSFSALCTDDPDRHSAQLVAERGRFPRSAAGSAAHAAGRARHGAVRVLWPHAPGHAAGGGVSGLPRPQRRCGALSRAWLHPRRQAGLAGVSPDQRAAAAAVWSVRVLGGARAAAAGPGGPWRRAGGIARRGRGHGLPLPRAAAAVAQPGALAAAAW